MQRYYKFAAGLLLGLIAPALHAADTQFWTAWNVGEWKSGNFSTKSHFENRHADDLDLIYVRYSQKFNYKLDDVWSLGLHPVYETSRGSDDWKDTYRLDLEATTKLKLTDRLGLKLRHRYEVRRKEGKGSEAMDRVRQQVALSYKANWLPSMTSIGIANEWFYEIDKERITLDRFYPIQIGFQPSDSFKTTVYYLYQSKRQGLSDDWSGTHIIGLSSSFKF